MIELKNVSKYYHANGVTNLGLRNVSLKLNKNEIVAITGDSGSGKTTLLNVICKIDTFDEGEIYFKGNDTSYFSIEDMDDFRKNKIGFIFQNYRILDSYTVEENVMLPLLLKGISRKQAKVEALSLIEKVGLKGKEKNRGTLLSGGEKQRCVIARALASDCEILACDEPTGNLDSATGKEIIKLIKEVAKDKLVLIVTHNFEAVSDVATRKIRVADGEIVEDVTFVAAPDDEKVELNLDYVKLKTRVKVGVAANNVVFTPKLTILLTAIFLVICLATLFMYQSVLWTNTNLGSFNYVYDGYVCRQKNRLFVSKTDFSAIDLNDFSTLTASQTEINPFYEDSYLNTVFIFRSAVYNAHVGDFTLYAGSLPDADNEYVVVVADESSAKEIQRYYMGYETLGLMSSTLFRLVGVGVSSNVSTDTVTLCDKLLQEQKLYMLSHNDYGNGVISFDVKATYEQNSATKEFSGIVSETDYDSRYTKSYPSLVVPYTSFNVENATLIYQSLYECAFDLEVVYDADASAPCLVFGDNCADFASTLPVFEMTVYTDSKDNTAKLFGDGFTVNDVALVKRGETLASLMGNLIAYLIVGLVSLSLIVVFFISYMILSRVYASKKKDYGILRTLGVTSKDMKGIVFWEVSLVSFSTMILAFAVFLILTNCIAQLAFLSHVAALTVVIYFVVMTLFSLALVSRLNKKLFKFSVAASLKEDAQ